MAAHRIQIKNPFQTHAILASYYNQGNCSADSFKLNTRDSIQYNTIQFLQGGEKNARKLHLGSDQTLFIYVSSARLLTFSNAGCSCFTAESIFNSRMKQDWAPVLQASVFIPLAGKQMWTCGRLQLSNSLYCLPEVMGIRFYPSDPSLVTDRYMPHEACYHCS